MSTRHTFEELISLIIDDYRRNHRRSLATLQHRLPHLRTFFSSTRPTAISTTLATRYVDQRLRERASTATVNRELAALRRMLRLAADAGYIDRVPAIKLLREDNVRTGFVDRSTLDKLCTGLPQVVSDAAIFAFLSSWRKSEVLDLIWGEVDMERREIRLHPKRSKSGRGRVLPLAGELWTIIERRFASRHDSAAYVFHCDGHRLKDFRRSWRTAAKRAGANNLLFHDLRRSAIRNFVRAGIPERVAMALSGHRTRATFDRYNIVSTDDLSDAIRRVA